MFVRWDAMPGAQINQLSLSLLSITTALDRLIEIENSVILIFFKEKNIGKKNIFPGILQFSAWLLVYIFLSLIHSFTR